MKIGIITHYYNSKNYGGNLQAYALCEVCRKFGYTAEQISYDIRGAACDCITQKTQLKDLKKCVVKTIFFLYRNFKRREWNSYIESVEVREREFEEFRTGLVPHSSEVYNSDNIADSNRNYDVFITGSDQVWNIMYYRSAYFLDFVAEGKIKLSYAASISKNSLTESQREIIRKSLKDYKAISVREKSDAELIKDLSPIEPIVTLDPTLLLDRDEWDKVCGERIIEEKYLFCYFLGFNIKHRELAEKFARQNNLKIVTLPHMTGFSFPDRKFGDYKLYDVSPNKFLSLIKHSEYVFTDSFHAVVFSYIYGRQFFVFNRNASGGMNSRIYNISELLNCKERFCDSKDKESVTYLKSLNDIDYSAESAEYCNMREKSFEFLKSNLQNAAKINGARD